MLARVYLFIEQSSRFKCLFISFFLLFRNCLLYLFFILHLLAFKEPNLDPILGPFPSQFRLISAGPIASPAASRPSSEQLQPNEQFLLCSREAHCWPATSSAKPTRMSSFLAQGRHPAVPYSCMHAGPDDTPFACSPAAKSGHFPCCAREADPLLHRRATPRPFSCA